VVITVLIRILTGIVAYWSETVWVWMDTL